MVQSKLLQVVFGTLLAAASIARAQTSLYIPGFDPQPISADIAGVDSANRTTWLLHKGRPTGSAGGDADFVGTATLVEGASDASFTYANPAFTMGIQCSFSSNLAICTGPNESGAPATATETVSRFAVQVGSTLTAQPSSSTSNSSSTSSGASSSNSRSLSSGLPTTTRSGGGLANATSLSYGIANQVPVALVGFSVAIALGSL